MISEFGIETQSTSVIRDLDTDQYTYTHVKKKKIQHKDTDNKTASSLCNILIWAFFKKKNIFVWQTMAPIT